MATHPSGGDPRLIARPAAEAGSLPLVARPRAGLPAWAIGGGVLVAGLLLFTLLDARRRALEAPAVAVRPADRLAGSSAAPPALYVPPEAGPVPIEMQPAIAPATPPAPASAAPPRPQIIYVPQPVPAPAPVEPPPPPPRVASEPTLVFDAGATAPAPAAAAGGAPAASAPTATGPSAGLPSRVRAGVFANRATTVPQGTLIPAVLETALNSTRPGFARAIVSRDVRGFDGSRVLIPRGSRLIGEYRSEVAPGQRRALVEWTRLVRPDGVTIAIGSPAADTLGGGGIRARVNTHFFERFAGAILQSVLDIGVNLAARSGSNGTVVILPGSVQPVSQIIQPQQITNTLTVRQGTSISIFVARDLDFTGAERTR
jgi:type IV secretion system protein VirB10